MATWDPHPPFQLAGQSQQVVRGRERSGQEHCCLRASNDLGSLFVQSRLPRRQRVALAPDRNPAPWNSPDQPSGRRAPGLSGHDAPLGGSQPCRGGRGCPRKPPLGADASLWVGRSVVGESDPSAELRRPKSGGFLRSAGVAFARDPGSAGSQAAHPCPSLCSARPAGGAAPPLGAPLTAVALPAPLPGRPLRPRWEPGHRGRSRQPQQRPVFVASSRSPARSRLATTGFTRGWGSCLLRGLHAPAAAPAPRRHALAPAGCKEQRRERTGPSSCCSEPRVWGEGKPASGGGGSGSERRRLGCSLGGLAPSNSRFRWRRADARTAGGMVHRRASSSAAAGERAPGSHAPMAPDIARVAAGAAASRCLPRAGASPCLRPGCRAPLAAGPALRLSQPARAASPRSCWPAVLPAAPLRPD
jgi:hypothetical protein